MKLLYCPDCEDVVGLSRRYRTCLCGKSGGAYLDEINVEIQGPAFVLGIRNTSFASALRSQPRGREFVAFFISRDDPTITYTGDR